MRTLARQRDPSQGRASSGGASQKGATSAPTELMNPFLQLQRMIGNQAVQRLLQADSNGPGADSCAGTSARLASRLSRMPAHPTSPVIMPTKLALKAPADTYQHGADRAADQVMRMPEPRLQRACACGGTCSACRGKQEHEHVQTNRVDESGSGRTEAPPIVHEVLLSPGQALDAATRAFMQPRFGRDFSHVRVHADELAAESAAAVGARAYTVGPDIVFARAQYSPASASGRRLLAHELAHVVQQRPGTPA